MGRACCVVGCKSHDRRGRKSDREARFFRFPTWKRSFGQQADEITKKRRMAWVAAVRRKNITFANISRCKFVCSRHFHKGQPAYEMMETDPDWAPSLHLGHTDIKHTDTARSARRSKRELLKKQALQGAERRVHRGQLHTEEGGHQAGDRSQLHTEDGGHQAGDRFRLHSEEGGHQAGDRFQLHSEEGGHQAGDRFQLHSEEGGHQAGDRFQLHTEEGGHTECNLCVLMCAEVNRLMEENRELRRELDEYRMPGGLAPQVGSACATPSPSFPRLPIMTVRGTFDETVIFLCKPGTFDCMAR